MMSIRRLFVLLAVILVTAVSVSASGAYKDRDGGAHAWSIDPAHTLIWDKAAYVPFGVVFEPRYLTIGQTEANWTADEQDVMAFKLAGATDIVIRPSKGLTTLPTAAVQRMIDLLEKNGLRYGIQLYDPDYAVLFGYVIQPTVYRNDGLTTSGEVAHDLPGADTAIYALCDAKTGEVRDYGRQDVVDGRIVTPMVIRDGSAHVMLYYPRQPMSSAGLYDVWRGFDQHRDRLIVYLRQIKFGPGLRFFMDPFGENFGMGGESDSIVPTSTAFRFEYAAWLTKRYSSPGNLNVAWQIIKHDVSSFDEASRLIPLWKDGRGAAVVYDDAMAKTYLADASKSTIWNDLQEFKASSIRSYMDAMADVAKRVSADVPVVYTATGLQSIFRATGTVGYDGLVMPDSENAKSMMLSAGWTLSLAESSSRSMWLVAHIKPTGGTYQKKEDLFGAMNTAHDLGAKGFFVDDARDSGVDGANLISWLAEYAGMSAGDKRFALYKPNVLYYPANMAQIGIKRLSNGAWWLPSLSTGFPLNVGKTLGAYGVPDPATLQSVVCVWSMTGPQTVQFAASSAVRVTDASGAMVDAKPKRGRITLVLKDQPVFVRGVSPDEFIPISMVEEAIQGLQDVIARAEQKRMDTGDYKQKLKSARAMMDANQLSLCLDLVRESVAELTQRLRGLEIMPNVNFDTTGK